MILRLKTGAVISPLVLFFGLFSLVNDSYGRTNPNKVIDCLGRTLIWQAKTKEEAQALVDAGANVNYHLPAYDCDNDYIHNTITVLHEHTSGEVIDVYLKAGANPDIEDSYGFRPLHDGKKSPEAVEVLLNAGADPNAMSRGTELRPLHYALHPGAIKALLRAGANPNAKDHHRGNTPLHDGKKSPEAVEVLLNAGADPNIQNRSGDTPLHKQNNLGSINALLNAGADPNLKNKEGVTARESNSLVDTAVMRKRMKQKASSSRKQANEPFPASHPEGICEYVSEQTQIKAHQCGQRSLCIAEISCTINLGLGSNTVQITRNYPAVCSALADGQCPTANKCASDRSVVEADYSEETEKSTATSQPSSNKTSKGAGAVQ